MKDIDKLYNQWRGIDDNLVETCKEELKDCAKELEKCGVLEEGILGFVPEDIENYEENGYNDENEFIWQCGVRYTDTDGLGYIGLDFQLTPDGEIVYTYYIPITGHGQAYPEDLEEGFDYFSTDLNRADILYDRLWEVKRKIERLKGPNEEARRKADEEAEEEAKRKADEEAKRKAEEAAKRKADEEAKSKAEEEAKRKADEEAKRKAEEEKRAAEKRKEAAEKRKPKKEAELKAAAKDQAGDAEAQYEMGVDCEGNDDMEGAEKWFRMAAEQGHADAQYNLALRLTYDEEYAEAFKWLLTAAKQGHVDAQKEVADWYMNGYGEVEKDEKEAVKWYRKAADQGDAEALNELGDCLRTGTGVGKNIEEAVKKYREAAAKGDENAQYHLAMRYYKGDGVQQSYEEAAKWFRKAADGGVEDAQYRLAECYKHGVGTQRNRKEADKLYHKAADSGSNKAKEEFKRRSRWKTRLIVTGWVAGALLIVVSGFIPTEKWNDGGWIWAFAGVIALAAAYLIVVKVLENRKR